MVDNWNPEEKPNEIWKANENNYHHVILIYDDRIETYDYDSSGSGDDSIDPRVGPEVFEGKLIASSSEVGEDKISHYYPYVILDEDREILWLSYKERDELYRLDSVNRNEKDNEPLRDRQFLRDHNYRKVASTKKEYILDGNPRKHHKPEDFDGAWD